jgi:ElaB/YqjD/DUF883 family membrane-anchored ribosome-binding protein
MAQEPNLTSKPPDEIRRDIDQTRSSLTNKLETLEEQVRETVHGARETVEETIANVKGTVHDTVEAVKRNLDLSHQTQQHPWAMFGGSVVAGFVLGSLVPTVGPRTYRSARGSRLEKAEVQTRAEPEYVSRPQQEFSAETGNGAADHGQHAPAQRRPGLLSGLLDQFRPEIEQLKQMAIGAAVGVVRDFVKESVPPALGPQVERVLDSATTKLGGRPIEGNVVEHFRSAADTHWG